MFSFESDALLVDDREDLIALLRMRFGSIPGEMIEDIYSINDMNLLQRLILSAANAANWPVFLEDFHSGRNSYRLVGENFNPLRDLMKGRDELNGTE
ncbi:hypothetical protein COJ85_03825 [Bacillus sp. AFS076308]|uniref:hypothetical protein n=1 Tax=unclassified Bacillus (in: firmicutes) TaxID=185979 RepID=UPI000BF975C4|nr:MULTISPECIES: hypothetical protein [unclassified Bacillus (in: firmicutes)]PFO08379.1 hypothetical protein COJ85_03825 [Bacillus sp. AFS076308]PGV50612.1 hypothetical protein COD92_16865 [Bacillus sp. AFS037270]